MLCWVKPFFFLLTGCLAFNMEWVIHVQNSIFVDFGTGYMYFRDTCIKSPPKRSAIVTQPLVLLKGQMYVKSWPNVDTSFKIWTCVQTTLRWVHGRHGRLLASARKLPKKPFECSCARCNSKIRIFSLGMKNIHSYKKTQRVYSGTSRGFPSSSSDSLNSSKRRGSNSILKDKKENLWNKCIAFSSVPKLNSTKMKLLFFLLSTVLMRSISIPINGCSGM